MLLLTGLWFLLAWSSGSEEAGAPEAGESEESEADIPPIGLSPGQTAPPTTTPFVGRLGVVPAFAQGDDLALRSDSVLTVIDLDTAERSEVDVGELPTDRPGLADTFAFVGDVLVAANPDGVWSWPDVTDAPVRIADGLEVVPWPGRSAVWLINVNQVSSRGPEVRAFDLTEPSAPVEIVSHGPVERAIGATADGFVFSEGGRVFTLGEFGVTDLGAGEPVALGASDVWLWTCDASAHCGAEVTGADEPASAGVGMADATAFDTTEVSVSPDSRFTAVTRILDRRRILMVRDRGRDTISEIVGPGPAVWAPDSDWVLVPRVDGGRRAIDPATGEVAPFALTLPSDVEIQIIAR